LLLLGFIRLHALFVEPEVYGTSFNDDVVEIEAKFIYEHLACLVTHLRSSDSILSVSAERIGFALDVSFEKDHPPYALFFGHIYFR
jgi:hypothetical protein